MSALITESVSMASAFAIKASAEPTAHRALVPITAPITEPAIKL